MGVIKPRVLAMKAQELAEQSLTFDTTTFYRPAMSLISVTCLKDQMLLYSLILGPFTNSQLIDSHPTR